MGVVFADLELLLHIDAVGKGTSGAQRMVFMSTPTLDPERETAWVVFSLGGCSDVKT